MQEKIKKEKYIRKDDPELDSSVEYINYLIDAYTQTSDLTYRDALLDAFDCYFKKYIAIMHVKSSGVNFNNSDTKNFLRLFMRKEDRITQEAYLSAAGSCLHMIRRVLLGFTAEDPYHELIVLFLEQLERYKPITYKRAGGVHRISFAHFIQVNMRFRLCKWIIKNSKDVITGRDCLEYKEHLHETPRNSIPGPEDFSGGPIGIDLKDWVWGNTSTAPFKNLTEMERYLLWLRFECDPDGKRLSTREMALSTGYHERSIIYKLNKIKIKLRRKSI